MFICRVVHVDCGVMRMREGLLRKKKYVAAPWLCTQQLPAVHMLDIRGC